MKYIILDLDNCISEDEWRLKYIDHEQKSSMGKHHAYNMLAGWDKCRNQIIFRPFNKRKIIIFTSRPMLYKPITDEWLRRNAINPMAKFIRPPGDVCGSVDLKYNFLRVLRNEHHVSNRDIVCAYDDKIEVINMYKNEGVNARLVAIHENND